MSIDHKTQDLLDEKKANWEGDVKKTWLNEMKTGPLPTMLEVLVVCYIT